MANPKPDDPMYLKYTNLRGIADRLRPTVKATGAKARLTSMKEDGQRRLRLIIEWTESNGEVAIVVALGDRRDWESPDASLMDVVVEGVVQGKVKAKTHTFVMANPASFEEGLVLLEEIISGQQTGLE